MLRGVSVDPIARATSELREAVEAFSRDGASPRETLLAAVDAHVKPILPPGDVGLSLPAEVLHRLTTLYEDLHRHGHIAETIARMTDQQVRGMMKEIADLLSMLEGYRRA